MATDSKSGAPERSDAERGNEDEAARGNDGKGARGNEAAPETAGENAAEESLGSGFDPTDPNSPLAPLYMQFSHLIILVIIGLYLAYTNLSRPPAAIWTDLKYGQWITANGRVPDREPFSSYSDPQGPCLRSDWLGQVIFYRVYRIGERMGGNDPMRRTEAGLEMLRVLHLALNLTLLFFLAAACRRNSSLPFACVGLLLLIPAAPLVFGRLSTEQFGLVCFALILAALSRPVLTRRALIVIPLAFMLWANTHPSMLIGLVLVTVFLVGRLIEACLEQRCANPWRAFRDKQVLRLLVVVLLSVVATFVNPYGLSVYARFIDLYRNANVADMPGWGPLDFSTWKLFPVLMLAIYILLAVTQAISPRAFAPTQTALILILGVFPLWKLRLMVWWFVLAPWLLLPHWQAAGAQIKSRWLSYQSIPSLRKTFAGAMIAVLIIAAIGPGSFLLSRKPRSLTAALPADTPWRIAAQLNANSLIHTNAHAPLAARLREHYPDARFEGVILTSEGTGDYLHWALPGKWPVYIYSELPSFPARHWSECQAIYNARADWWELLDRRHINLIVVERERARKLAEALPKDVAWAILPDRVDARGQGVDGPLLIAIRKQPIRPLGTP